MMHALASNKNLHFSLHFLPAFLKFENKMSPPTSSSRQCGTGAFREPFTRESSYDSTIHHRRTMSRKTSASPPPPPSLPVNGFADFFRSRPVISIEIPRIGESDAACWERMLMLQWEYHCYKSARLEAAVEALEMGFAIEEVPIRMLLCLRYLYNDIELTLHSFETLLEPIEWGIESTNRVGPPRVLLTLQLLPVRDPLISLRCGSVHYFVICVKWWIRLGNFFGSVIEGIQIDTGVIRFSILAKALASRWYPLYFQLHQFLTLIYTERL